MLNSLRVLGKKFSSLSRNTLTCKTAIRLVSTINSPEYPSDRDSELVNDEFYEIMGNELVEELGEAVEEPSPYKYEALNLVPKQIQEDPSIADRMQEYYKRSVKSIPATKRMEYFFEKKMNLKEIWDTDLLPLAPVRRPKDIPEDHEIDIWSYNDWRNVALTGSTHSDSKSDQDPRIVQSLDPRLTSMAEKLLQPLMNSTEDRSSLFNDIEEEPLRCQFEPSTNEEMTVNQAKQIMKKVMVKKEEKQTFTQPDETPIEKEPESKLPDFDIDNFRQLVQEYRSTSSEDEIVTKPFDTGFILKIRNVDKKKANMTRRLASALICNGTETGGVAVGYARSEKSPDAAMKAEADAIHHRLFVELYEDRTLFAPVAGKFNQTRVKILPAKRGHGIKGSDLMYGILSSMGVQDAICKVYGNTNPFSVTQATMIALSKCMSLEEHALRTGRRYFDLDTIYKRQAAKSS